MIYQVTSIYIIFCTVLALLDATCINIVVCPQKLWTLFVISSIPFSIESRLVFCFVGATLLRSDMPVTSDLFAFSIQYSIFTWHPPECFTFAIERTEVSEEPSFQC